MADGKFVSYLRVSTARQGISGLGLDAQRESVAGFLRGGKASLIREVVEIESGKKNDRPALAAAINLCLAHRATLLIAKLDRLARNIHFITGLMEAGVPFVAVDLPEASPLIIHIMAAFAQHERQAISSRTKAALAAAKARGVRLGGLRGDAARMAEIAPKGSKAGAIVRCAKAAKRRAAIRPAIEEIRSTGASTLRQIAAELNTRGFETPRGGQWSAVQVQRVIESSANGLNSRVPSLVVTKAA